MCAGSIRQDGSGDSEDKMAARVTKVKIVTSVALVIKVLLLMKLTIVTILDLDNRRDDNDCGYSDGGASRISSLLMTMPLTTIVMVM